MDKRRIVVSVVCFILVLHFLTSFKRQDNKPQALSLPWYTTSHPDMSSLQDNQHIKTNLTTQERQELVDKMVKKATTLAKKSFSGIQGIPGYIPSNEKAQQFRSRVDCWTTGEWKQVESPEYVMPHFQDPLYGSCERKYKQDGLRPAVRYEWISKCQQDHVPMDPAKWCQVLNGRHILIVGDLVQYQLHEVFLDTLRDGPAVCFGELNCKDHTVCSEPESRIRYLRNDILSLRRKMDQNHGNPRGDIIEWPFIVGGLLKNFEILVVNRAPVLESDEEFMTGLIDTIKTIRKQNPNSLIIYRSTGIGHPFCDEASEPLKERLTDEEMKELPYGWSELNRRNAIARAVIEGSGGIFVDLAALSDVRPDGHIGGQDCLRYCIPGPLTGWAQILYQVFLGLEEATRVH